jgi:hypothetical protein
MILRAAIVAAALALEACGTEVNLALFRFRAIDKGQMISAVRIDVPAAKLKTEKTEAVLAALKRRGAAALIFQASERLPDEKPKMFERSETATVVLPADSTKLPAMTRIAVKFQLQCGAAAGGKFDLAWDGTVKWSPMLLDRSRASALPFAQTNLSLLKPLEIFADDVGFEYPVLKETAFQSSRLVKEGELAICTTAAESGGTAPEILVLCVWAFKE